MAYIINRFDGTQLTIVDDGVLDTSTPLGLIGRNYTGYGEVQNENFIFLLENFANNSPPARALTGQAWYDKSAKALKVYNGSAWLSIGNATVSETEPAHSNGGLWLKVTTQQLFISDGIVWRQVGPEAAEGFEITKLTSTVLKDTSEINKPVILTQINGETISIISGEEFTISTSTPVDGFEKLYRGINFKSNTLIVGNLKGIADSAVKLQNPKTINDVEFDGTKNIIVKSSTTQPLKPGDFILGSEFNGSFEDTWDINATSENILGTIVARNSVGGFSATSINADLFGNVTGNVFTLSGTSTFDQVIAKNVTADTFTGLAARATKLAARRTINTIPFDGTEDITLPVPADTLIGTVLAPNVVNSSLVTLGKLENLEIEAPGLLIGDGNNLYIRVEGFTPTLESEVNHLKFKLTKGSTTQNQSGISYISAASAGQLGVLNPALVPDYSTNVPAAQRHVLGLPQYRWRNVYSEFLTADTTVTTTLSGPSIQNQPNQVTVSNNLVIQGTMYGNVTGSLTGNVVGSVTGASSLNLLKAGDTMSGDINWSATGRGLTWVMNTDSASIRFYNLNDADTDARLEFNTSDNNNEYFRWTHTPAGGGATYESMRLTPNANGLANLRVTGQITVTAGVSAATYIGDGNQLTNLNASQILTGTVPVSRLSGSYNINISGNAATATTAITANSANANIFRTGDTMSGRLGQSVSGFHAASIENIATRTNSGFYDWPNPSTAKGWPVNGSWHHLLSSTHVNDANYYAMQFSADFYAQNLYYRSTAGNGNTGWSKILHSNNFNDYSPTKTGAGASGTWNINITGNAGSVSNGVYSNIFYNNPNFISSLAGNKITGAVGLATDSNALGGYSLGQVLPYQSNRDFTNGTLIISDINYSITYGEPWLLEIEGNSYGAQIPFDIKYQGYIYYDTIINHGGISTGTNISGLSVFLYTGRLCFWFPRQQYWQGFTVRINSSYAGSIKNRLVSITDSIKPIGISKEVSLSPNIRQVLHTGNYNDYVPTRTGGGASGTWPINITGNATSVTSITSTQITNALGYTPYSNSNPSGFITASSAVARGEYRNFGTITFSINGLNATCTTAQFINYLSSLGMFSYSHAVAKASWYYAGNNDITDTGFGQFDLAGCVIEVFNDGSTRHVRITRPTTGAGGFQVIVWNDQGIGYSPGWRAYITSENYTSFSPSLTGAGASGTWPINISGTAAAASSVAWSSVTGKPSIVINDGGTYSINVTGSASSANAASWINNLGTITAETNGTAEPSYKLTLRSVYNNGYPTTYGNAITLGGGGGGELLIGWSGTTGAHADNYVRSRRDTGNTWSPWARLITDVNYNSYAPSLSGSGATGTWPINISGTAASVSSVSSAAIVSGLGYTPVSKSGDTINGELNLQDNNLRRATIIDYSLYHNALGNVSGTTTVNMEAGNYVSATAVGAVTWVFSNPPTGARVGSIIMELTNGGAYTQYWPASVRWPSGSAPSLTASGVDVLVFISDDGGSNWRGAISMGDSK